MRVLAVLLAAVALAGCSDAPPAPIVAGEAVLGEGTPPPPREPVELEWWTLAETSFFFAPGQQTIIPVNVPNGTLSLSVNMTLETGSAYGISVQVGACHWRRDVAFVAEGQEIVADCGGILEGPDNVTLDAQAGALQGRVAVVALLCRAGGCPGRMPVAGAE